MMTTKEEEPRAIEMGQITTVGLDGPDTQHTYPMALLIVFPDAKSLGKAIKVGQVTFRVFA
jgi:hypothetical protein